MEPSFYTTLITKSQNLIDKIKESMIYPDRGNSQSGYLDICYLLGISKEKCTIDNINEMMNEEELEEYNKFFVIKREKNYRCIHLYEGGFKCLMFDYDGLLLNLPLAITQVYKDAEISIRVVDEEHETFDEYGYCENEEYFYRIKNGKHLSKAGMDIAIQYANNGELDFAIKLLRTYVNSNDEDAKNNYGVCFERKKDYDTAAYWYKSSNIELAKYNLLKLYVSNKIAFDEQEYQNACNYLIAADNPYGHLYEAYILENQKENKAKIINLLDDGAKLAKSKKMDECYYRLIFEKAYALDLFSDDKDSLLISHKLYEELLNSKIDEYEDLLKTIKYNYALQCFYGRGCQKDKKKAIDAFIESALMCYKDAMTKLVNIYTNDEEYKDLTKAEEWKQTIQELELSIEE